MCVVLVENELYSSDAGSNVTCIGAHEKTVCVIWLEKGDRGRV